MALGRQRGRLAVVLGVPRLRTRRCPTSLLYMSAFAKLLLVGALGCSVAACETKPKTNVAPTAAPAPAVGAVGSPAKLAVGDKAHCPVTGEDFVVAASTTQVEHEGKFYAFCCPDCQPAFNKDPAKYIKKN